MARILSDQNDTAVITKIILDNGLTITLFASPLSARAGRETLGNFTEDYTLIGILQPPGGVYPFLKNTPMSASYIGEKLMISGDVLALVARLMPKLTIIDLPDLIINEAEKWYAEYYGQNQQLTLI